MIATQLAVTTETDFGVDTPETVGVEFEPPVLLPDVLPPDVPVELVLPELPDPLPAVVSPPPHPTRRMTSATVHARHDHVLKDI